MISEFHRLKEAYGSKEITMDDLKTIQAGDIVSFENHGISRTNKACLLCEIRFDRLDELLGTLTAAPFSSPQKLREYVESAKLPLSVQEREEEGLIIFSDAGSHVEIIAQLNSDGTVSVEADDIDAVTSFQVFLRIQH